VGLFAGGLGVGAAAYGATVGPRATTNDPPFGIDCYTNAASAGPAVQIGMDSSSLLSDPVKSCQTQQDVQSGANVTDIAITQYLTTSEAECIVISSPGSSDLYAWKSGQDVASHEVAPFWVREPRASDEIVYEGSGTKPAGFPADCLPVTIPATTAPQVAYGACKIDSKHVAVFPLGALSVAQVCRSHRLTPWGA
jgi:hypothetical protein